MRKTFALRRTKTLFGCNELGYVERDGCRDAEEEVRRYTEHLEEKLPVGKRIVEVGHRAAVLDGYPEEK